MSDRSSQILRVGLDGQAEVIKDLPELQGLHRSYPNTGGSAMLSLTAANSYNAQIMICGGGEENEPWSMTDDTCAIIQPLTVKPRWKTTKLRGGPRTMVEAVLLLDGRTLWINGARKGAQGFGTASIPATEALIYDPTKDLWSSAGFSAVPRMYHSVALMLLDGTILIAGSNPNEMPVLEQDVDAKNPLRAFPTEFRIEKYTPPYLLGRSAKLRPRNIRVSPAAIVDGRQAFRIKFTLAQSQFKDLKFYLYTNGFVTHSLHMGQTMIELEVHQKTGDSEMTIAMPAIKVAPGPYVVYVVVDGVPGIAQFVTVNST